MLVVTTRFAVPAPDGDAFRARVEPALDALAGRPGYRGGRLARSADDGELWVLVTEWQTVGHWRRALSSYDVKMTVTPVLAEALDEPSVFEVLYAVDASGVAQRDESDRAPDADTAGPVR